jgi:hypothetical protein
MAAPSKQPPRGEIAADEVAAYDAVVDRQVSYGYAQAGSAYLPRESDEAAGPYFGALLYAPRIAHLISELGAVYRELGEVPGSYVHWQREWVDIVLGHKLGRNLWGHVADGMAVGVRPEAVIAVLEDRLDDLTEEEAVLADYITSFADGAVTPGMWDRLEEHLGSTRAVVEYTALCGHLLMTFRLIQTFFADRVPAPSDEEVIARVRKVIAGELELPDPHARVGGAVRRETEN